MPFESSTGVGSGYHPKMLLEGRIDALETPPDIKDLPLLVWHWSFRDSEFDAAGFWFWFAFLAVAIVAVVFADSK